LGQGKPADAANCGPIPPMHFVLPIENNQLECALPLAAAVCRIA
jgi:hypothetical protein